MKKILSLVLVVVMLVATFALAASAKVGDGYHNYGEIANVERDSLRLDAVKDSVYDKATPIPIKYQSIKESGVPNKFYTDNGGRDNGDPAAEAVAYMVYDTQYIWVYVEVTDATLNTKAADPLSSSHKQDSIEILVDWTNEGKNVPDETPYQSRLTHEGYISARVGQKGATLNGTADQGSPNPVNWLQGFAQHTDKGYDCEFRIDIPEDVTIGEYISINFVLNDYDSQGSSSSRIIISSNPVSGACDWLVDRLGYIKFNYAPYTADTTVIYVVVAMVVALAIGGVTLVSLKRRVASK